MTKGVGQSAAEKASQAAQKAKEKAQQGKEGSGSILQRRNIAPGIRFSIKVKLGESYCRWSMRGLKKNYDVDVCSSLSEGKASTTICKRRRVTHSTQKIRVRYHNV